LSFNGFSKIFDIYRMPFAALKQKKVNSGSYIFYKIRITLSSLFTFFDDSGVLLSADIT